VPSPRSRPRGWPATVATGRQVAVDDEQRGTGEPADAFAQASLSFGFGQRGDDVGEGREVDCGRPSPPRRRAPPPGATCRFRAKQRHTAGCPAFEVRITYPFHPRSGETVAVVGSRRHAGAEHLIIRQPDRSLALLLAWMTEAGASPRPLLSYPRFPSVRRSNTDTGAAAGVSGTTAPGSCLGS
jgi:hypothetical protein